MKKNHHCNVLAVSGCGILIEGPSGSGKSSLTFGLLEKSAQMGFENALVCDDQALLAIEDGALVARAPEAIEGKIELRGHGIISIPSIRSCSVSLIVRMIEDENVQRMPDCTPDGTAGNRDSFGRSAGSP